MFNSRVEEICKRLPKNVPIIGAEIGVWKGRTSESLLENLPNLTLYMIDAWADPVTIPSFFNSGAKMAGFPKESYDRAFDQVYQIHLKYYNRSFIRRLTSIEAAVEFKNNYFDFIFLDGDHSFEGMSLDLETWLPKLKTGSLFCGHDYDNPYADYASKGVKKAVDERFKDIELGQDHTWFWTVK